MTTDDPVTVGIGAFADRIGTGILIGEIVAAVIWYLLMHVNLSTVGSWITLRERVWMAAVSPRGIIPASVATLFVLELRAQRSRLRRDVQEPSCS